jgi:ribosome recycling factor
MDEYLEAMTDDMDGAVKALERELVKVRTGRATPKLVEGVQVLVQSYGANMPLNQLATINAPDARLLVVTPWDKTTIPDIERAIVGSGLGLNPSSDGQIVRLPVPPLTADRRAELVRQVRKVGEDSKVRIRHIRREYNEMFKSAEKDGDLPEDDCRRLLAKVQDATDVHIGLIESTLAAKEAEVQEV